MLTTTYRRAQAVRFISIIIAALLLTIMIFKVYNSLLKIYDYSQATAFLSKKDVIAAEEYYDKAASNEWIQYHDLETAQSLSALSPVTEIKTSLSEILIQNSGDPQAVLTAFNSYQNIKKSAVGNGSNYNSIFTNMIAHLGIDNHFKDAFAESKKEISKQLVTGISKKNFSDPLVASLLEIPVLFFDGPEQRMTEIRSKLEPYDHARIDSMAKEKQFNEVLNEGVRLQALYVDLKVQPNWLLPIIEQYAISHMEAALAKNDIGRFSQDAKTYASTKEFALKHSNVMAYIQTTYAKQSQNAERLGNENKYGQAIETYQKLNNFRDTSKEIQDIQLKWSANEPNHILQTVLPGKEFSSIINGRDRLGALLYAIGITDGKLVVARMLSDMSMDKKETGLDKNLRLKTIKIADNSSVRGLPVLVLECSSSVRKARYVAFELHGSGLTQVFDIEADGYKLDKSGTMVVDNATGKGTGQTAFYEYSNGKYNFSKIKPDYVEISLKDLRKYKNVKVRFICSVLAADNHTAVVLYNGEYILLQSKSKLHVGKAAVIGTWFGNDVIKKGAQSITAYKVNVFSATQ